MRTGSCPPFISRFTQDLVTVGVFAIFVNERISASAALESGRRGFESWFHNRMAKIDQFSS